MNNFVNMRNIQRKGEIGNIYPFQREKEYKNTPNEC